MRVINSPEGSEIVDEFCPLPVKRAISAAFEAAVAQVPVVNPLRKGKNPGAVFSMALRKPSCPVTVIKLSGNIGLLIAKMGIPNFLAASVFCIKYPLWPLSLVRMALGLSLWSKTDSSSPGV